LSAASLRSETRKLTSSTFFPVFNVFMINYG
jgi:hypothetical protein